MLRATRSSALVATYLALCSICACRTTSPPTPPHTAEPVPPIENSTAPLSKSATDESASDEANSLAGSPEKDYDTEPEAIGDDAEDDDEHGLSDDTARRSHPLERWSANQLSNQLKSRPRELGSASLGRPNGGALFNAVQLPENSAWKRVDPAHAWATAETIDDLTHALLAVAERYPNTSTPVPIGHLSAEHGGPLRPHVSHQSGRDVDVGFYYRAPENRWYRRGTKENLDVERTWWLIRTLVRDTDIEMILLDQSLSTLVESFAIAAGEEKEWVQGIFHNRNGRYAIVRHAAGHATHLHLRFFNPIAQESGRRLMPMLVERRIVTPPQKTVTHVVRPGETLAKLAARFGTTMQAIRDANAMRTYQLVAGKAYRIPVVGSTTESPRAQMPSRRAQVSSTRKN